jgi:hypothetical protein
MNIYVSGTRTRPSPQKMDDDFHLEFGGDVDYDVLTLSGMDLQDDDTQALYDMANAQLSGFETAGPTEGPSPASDQSVSSSSSSYTHIDPRDEHALNDARHEFVESAENDPELPRTAVEYYRSTQHVAARSEIEEKETFQTLLESFIRVQQLDKFKDFWESQMQADGFQPYSELVVPYFIQWPAAWDAIVKFLPLESVVALTSTRVAVLPFTLHQLMRFVAIAFERSNVDEISGVLLFLIQSYDVITFRLVLEQWFLTRSISMTTNDGNEERAMIMMKLITGLPNTVAENVGMLVRYTMLADDAARGISVLQPWLSSRGPYSEMVLAALFATLIELNATQMDLAIVHLKSLALDKFHPPRYVQRLREESEKWLQSIKRESDQMLLARRFRQWQRVMEFFKTVSGSFKMRTDSRVLDPSPAPPNRGRNVQRYFDLRKFVASIGVFIDEVILQWDHQSPATAVERRFSSATGQADAPVLHVSLTLLPGTANDFQLRRGSIQVKDVHFDTSLDNLLFSHLVSVLEQAATRSNDVLNTITVDTTSCDQRFLKACRRRRNWFHVANDNYFMFTTPLANMIVRLSVNGLVLVDDTYRALRTLNAKLLPEYVASSANPNISTVDSVSVTLHAMQGLSDVDIARHLVASGNRDRPGPRRVLVRFMPTFEARNDILRTQLIAFFVNVSSVWSRALAIDDRIFYFSSPKSWVNTGIYTPLPLFKRQPEDEHATPLTYTYTWFPTNIVNRDGQTKKGQATKMADFEPTDRPLMDLITFDARDNVYPKDATPNYPLAGTYGMRQEEGKEGKEGKDD